jgi:hypothetical protein
VPNFAKIKKKKPIRGCVFHTFPNNIQEQEKLFFDSGCTYNPQFDYNNPNYCQQYVDCFTQSSEEDDPELLNLSIQIIEQFLKEYGDE